MTALGTMHLLPVSIAMAMVAVAGGFLGAAMASRRRRRRTAFALGVICGLTAGVMMRRRRLPAIVGAVIRRRDGRGPRKSRLAATHRVDLRRLR